MVLTIEARLHDYKNSSFGDALELTLNLANRELPIVFARRANVQATTASYDIVGLYCIHGAERLRGCFACAFMDPCCTGQ
jgi:hypothetical protein